MKKYIVGLLLGCIVGICHAGVAQPPIITRAQRGADEALRLGGGGSITVPMQELKGADESVITPAQKRKIADEYLVTNFPNEFRTDSVVRTRNGQSILRPIQINHQKTKIVIHHTAGAIASDASYSDIVVALQDIYRFHTLTRRRGDIGYNYIIGPDGSIFEGRSGGPSAVGAHLVNNNASSIGISLMGNFDEAEPTPQQLQATIDLAARLADTYRIDVYKQTIYHQASDTDPYIVDHTDDSLVGHTDAGDTSCPGDNLYNKLSMIKKEVARMVGTTTVKDTTPTVTDPVKYYIPSTTYQLSVPWSQTTAVTSCAVLGTTWSVKKCTLAGGYLTLHLNKSTNQSHQGYHKLIIKTPKGQYYLYLSLEYKAPSASIGNPVASIPSKSSWYTGSKINVMLYNMTTTMNLWILSCTQGCTLTIDGASVVLKAGTRFQVTRKNNVLTFWWSNTQYAIPNLSISALGTGSIMVENYPRMINNVALNARKGSLNRGLGQYKPIGKPITTGMIVTNTVRVDDYMRGLYLVGPGSPQSYYDALYLAAHTNMRYRGSGLTDDGRIHQAYMGVGARLLNTKRQLSHDIYHDMLLKNGSNLTYAPWFECSVGWTRNGVQDLGVCSNGIVSGPGLGLSRLGAQMLAQRGYNARQILEYYYPGVVIES